MAVFSSLLTGIFFIALYCFFCYAMFKIGQKFHPGETYPKYLIPIYNGVLLCRLAGKSGWFVLVVIIPYIGALIFSVVVYGSIARRMGLSFWLYGLLSLLCSLSLFILAFNSAMPMGEMEERAQWQPVGTEEQDA